MPLFSSSSFSSSSPQDDKAIAEIRALQIHDRITSGSRLVAGPISNLLHTWELEVSILKKSDIAVMFACFNTILSQLSGCRFFEEYASSDRIVARLMDRGFRLLRHALVHIISAPDASSLSKDLPWTEAVTLFCTDSTRQLSDFFETHQVLLRGAAKQLQHIPWPHSAECLIEIQKAGWKHEGSVLKPDYCTCAKCDATVFGWRVYHDARRRHYRHCENHPSRANRSNRSSPIPRALFPDGVHVVKVQTCSDAFILTERSNTSDILT